MDENQNQGQNMGDQGGKQTFRARFKGADGSEGYESGTEYTLLKWEEDGRVFVSKEDGTGQVAYDTPEAMEQNWETMNQESAGAEEGQNSDQGADQTGGAQGGM